MRKKLTDTQRDLLKAVKAYIRLHKMPPTRTELSVEMGYRSRNAAQEVLKRLETKGYVELLKTPRGIRVL